MASAVEHPPSKLLQSYERELTTSRGLSPATVRNYLADLVPFTEYLATQDLSLGDDAKELRRFIGRDGERQIAGEYRSLVRDYVAWLMEERRLSSGKRRGARGHQRGSVTRTLVALRSFVRYLIDHRRLPESEVWSPRSTLMRRFTPRPEQRLPDVVSAQDAALLVEAPSDIPEGVGPAQRAGRRRDRALLELLYGCGLRVSEVTGLNVGDVASRTARVWGKGSKARMVPLGRQAEVALNAYVKNARPLLAGKASGGALFLNQRGGRLTPRTVQGMVRKYAMAAGIHDGVHPHTLRHSFATHLLDGGADLRVVQELLGHSTPSATQVYTHVSQAEARRVYLSAHPFARNADNDHPTG